MALISLVEYARRNGRDQSTAKQKAARGGFRTAIKIGRNWVIDEDEPYIDNRHKKKGEKAMKILYAGLVPTGTMDAAGGYCEWEWIESSELECGGTWDGDVRGCVENLLADSDCLESCEIASADTIYAIRNFPEGAVLICCNGTPMEIYWAEYILPRLLKISNIFFANRVK